MTRSHSNQKTVWEADTASVGPVKVFRPLPNSLVKSIGPFVMLDHFGPMPAPSEKLPAHPHAGIEVMTYLMEGANEHTDSLGNIGRIGPGGTQWMRSGRGILHTERNLTDLAPTFHGLQIWARLPIAEQHSEPDYRAIQADEQPVWRRDGSNFRLLAGEFEDRVGPIPLAIPSIMCHLTLDANSTLDIALPTRGYEYGIYVIDATNGIVLDDNQAMARGTMASLPPDTTSIRLACCGAGVANVFLLGGQAAPQPLHFGGPFVLDSQEALTKAQRRYLSGAMGTLDGVPF